jgi:hypothetical protein
MSASGFSPATRKRIWVRDAGGCQWCGLPIHEGQEYSIQHRRARGAGGSSRPETDLDGNGVLMHGTGTTGCHGHVEKYREESRARGFTLWQSCPVPADVPIQVEDPTVGRVWVRLVDGSSGKAFVPEKEAVAVLVAAGYRREEVAS